MYKKQKKKINDRKFEAVLLARGLTKKTLAKRLGLRRPDLWRRTAGRGAWSVSELHLLVEIVKVPEEWLFSEGNIVLYFRG
jgi:hypothetical protein